MVRPALPLLLPLLSLLLAGCATTPAGRGGADKAGGPDSADAERRYYATPAAALVFDPPLLADEPPLELARDRRAPAASLGFEDVVVEHFYIRTDDYQSDHGCPEFEHYERRAVSEKFGVRYR